MLAGEAEQALNAADGDDILFAVHVLAERADARARLLAAGQQLLGGARRVRGTVFVRNAMMAALLVEVLAQQLAGAGIEHSHDALIPLHLDVAADPARRRAVVSGIDFDAAVEVYSALAELIEAEGLDGQRKQSRFLLGKHSGHLTLGGAVDAVSLIQL